LSHFLIVNRGHACKWKHVVTCRGLLKFNNFG